MKKLFSLLFVLALLPASSLLAQQSLNPEVTSPVAWHFGGAVTVTWSFVNAVANPNGVTGETTYNAIVTITNNTPNEIQDWSLGMSEMDSINNIFGAGTWSGIGNNYTCQYDPMNRNVIPGNGSISFTYLATTKGEINKPSGLTFSAPSVALDWDPYND